MADFTVVLTNEERPKSRSPIEPDTTTKRKTNEHWCSYCGSIRLFMIDERYDVLRCKYCGISVNDFYIKNDNKLWEHFKPGVTKKQIVRRK